MSGKPGFVRFLGQSRLDLGNFVDQSFDPVLSTLLGSVQDGEAARSEISNHAVSALAINLSTRQRVKLSGKIVARSSEELGSTVGEESIVGQVQLVIKVEQSLGKLLLYSCRLIQSGTSNILESTRPLPVTISFMDMTADPYLIAAANCPKYLNKKEIVPSLTTPGSVSHSLPLEESATRLIGKVDLFFITSAHHRSSMSTNYRGGSPGFVRILANDLSGTTLVYPEFSGNRFYQTLGNLRTTPLAGIVFPDLDNGDVLYVTCITEIVVGKAAAALIARSNLAVKAKIVKAHFVRHSLPFRGRHGEPSPYNPPIRYLTSEGMQADAQANDDRTVYAKVLRKDILTPSIARFRFSISDPKAAGRWKPGQCVALAFEDELSAGYSHMRDDDPKSLNDDYVRTFTVSSALSQGLPHDEFEITMRNVGVVTDFLFKQNVRAALEIPLKGFGGGFDISQSVSGILPFVAGGIGITPLLPYLPQLDIARLRLYWTVNIRDYGLVNDTFKNNRSLASSTTLFLSGIGDSTNAENTSILAELERSQATVVTRRMIASDIESVQNLSSKWYVCTGNELRRSLLLWLSGKEVTFEEFDY